MTAQLFSHGDEDGFTRIAKFQWLDVLDTKGIAKLADAIVDKLNEIENVFVDRREEGTIARASFANLVRSVFDVPEFRAAQAGDDLEKIAVFLMKNPPSNVRNHFSLQEKRAIQKAIEETARENGRRGC